MGRILVSCIMKIKATVEFFMPEVKRAPTAIDMWEPALVFPESRENGLFHSSMKNQYRCIIERVFSIVSTIVDLNVRQRLARMRRNFLTLGWTSRQASAPATAAEPERDLILEDNLAAYKGIEAGSGVDWRKEDPGLFDDEESEWSPSSKTRAAVFGLAEKIRSEAEKLATLADRARMETQRLVREHAGSSSSALQLLTQIQDGDAAAGEDPQAPGTADWDAHFTALSDLIREIGATALSAALSGVRAGASTRGFSHVARGVEELERALRSSWDDIENMIAELEDRAAETAATAATLRNAGKSVIDSTANLPRLAGDVAAGSTSFDQLDRLNRLAEEITRTGEGVATACDAMADLVHRLAERLIIVVRETPVGDRRSAKRIAFQSSCIVSTSDRSFAGTSLDLSATGALVKLRQEPPLQRAQPITLHLQDMAPIIGTVAAVSAQGVHIAFDLGHVANAEARPALMQMLDALLTRSQELVNRTTRLARDLRLAMERGLEEGRITQAELLSTEYEEIEGSSKGEFRHRALSFYEETLTPVLAEVDAELPQAIYAVAMDRSGFVPVHRLCGSGEAQCSRGRRILADLLNQRAARNLRPFLIQVVPLDPAAAKHSVSIRSVSVPIFVGGRHWGCAEMGFRLEDGDAAFSTIGV